MISDEKNIILAAHKTITQALISITTSFTTTFSTNNYYILRIFICQRIMI